MAQNRLQECPGGSSSSCRFCHVLSSPLPPPNPNVSPHPHPVTGGRASCGPFPGPLTTGTSSSTLPQPPRTSWISYHRNCSPPEISVSNHSPLVLFISFFG